MANYVADRCNGGTWYSPALWYNASMIEALGRFYQLDSFMAVPIVRVSATDISTSDDAVLYAVNRFTFAIHVELILRFDST